MSISCGRGCIFSLFDDKRLKQCKVTSRWPREAPKTPQERPKSPQGGPKTAPRGSKMAPRWPHDGLKTANFHPSSFQVASKLASSRPCSTKLPPSRRQDGSSWQLGSTWPHLGPTWPHLGPPNCLQDGPKTPQDSNLTPTSPHLQHKNKHSVWEGSYFLTYPMACNMSPLGRRRGPALRASIRRRP